MLVREGEASATFVQGLEVAHDAGPPSDVVILEIPPDPRDQPAINPRYLPDQRAGRRSQISAPPVRRTGAGPADCRGKRSRSGRTADDELLDYARQNGAIVYHASCSSMTGQHAMGVVDDELRCTGSMRGGSSMHR